VENPTGSGDTDVSMKPDFQAFVAEACSRRLR
jgi:hypothetical protein